MYRLRTIAMGMILYAMYLWECRLYFSFYGIKNNLLNVILHTGLSAQCIVGIMTIVMLYNSMAEYNFYFGGMYVYRYGKITWAIGMFFQDRMYTLGFINFGMFLLNIGYIWMSKGERIILEQVRQQWLSFAVADLWVFIFIQSLIILNSIIREKKIVMVILILICIYIAFAPELIPFMKKWYDMEDVMTLMTDMKQYIREVIHLLIINLGLFVTTEVVMWKRDISV